MRILAHIFVTSDLSTGDRAAGALTDHSPHLVLMLRMSRVIFDLYVIVHR